MRDEEYFAIKDRAALALRRIPHITGVGIGGRERSGRPTGEIVIKVFVKRKKPAADVPAEEMIPASFEGVPTDVVEMGEAEPASSAVGAVAPASMPMEKVNHKPLRGGMVITIEKPKAADANFNTSGTIGCFLRDLDDDTAVYGLTNQHVVADGALSLSRRILHTSPSDPDAFQVLGYPAAGANEPEGDYAIVRIDPGFTWLPFIKDIGFIGPAGMHDITVAEAATQTYEVRKRGGRTGLTGGFVVAIDVARHFASAPKTNDTVIRAKPTGTPNQQVFFSFLGDSGSAVVNEDNEVVALLWGGESESTAQFPRSTATPIKAVLQRLKEVHGFDLMVAATPFVSGDEVSEVKEVLHFAGAPSMSGNDLFKRGDHTHRRPLVGGSQIVARPLGLSNSATLGCVMTHVDSPGKAFLLTSHEGLSGGGITSLTVDTDVGQPDNSESCSGCCSNTVGDFAHGGIEQVPTAALVELEDDQKWLAEIMQIGLIKEIAPPIVPGLIGDLQVLKRGAGSRLTGGVVTAVGGVGGDIPIEVRSDAILIRPNPNAAKPGQDIFFSHLTDRGALVMNTFNQVIGLLYDEFEVVENGVKIVHGVATPIRLVIDQLNTLPGVNVTLATTLLPNKVQTTTNRVATSLVTATPPIELPAAGAFDWLRDELAKSVNGRRVIDAWKEHRDEIRHLIDHNRKVATAWHRGGGPAVVQALSRSMDATSVLLPASVNGRPIAVCVDRLAQALTRYGSPALRVDVVRFRAALPTVGGYSFTEILAAL